MELTIVLGATAVVGAVAALWWGLTARPSPARGNLYSGLPEQPSAQSPLAETMRQLGTSARRAMPHVLVDGLEVRLVQAGLAGGLDLARLIGIKVTISVLGALLLLLYGQVLLALVVAVALFFLPDYWVLSARDDRHEQIRRDAADIIDQMTICVEAGLGFDAALSRVAKTTEGPLTDELRRTLSDIRAGVPRGQALRALADRAQVPEIRQLVTALLQAQKHGVPIAETLRVQAAEMRLKRTQRTEEQAAKLTVKMVFPIVVCFLPVFMIVTMVPAVITIFDAL